MEESYWAKTGISGVVCAFTSAMTNPADVVKIRMQNHSVAYPWPERGVFKSIIRLFREERWSGLTLGIRATMMREIIYSGIRIGGYEPIRNSMHNDPSVPAPAYVKYFSALISGAMGASIANPTDLVKVQFQSNMPGMKLPFTTTWQAFKYNYQQSGIQGLYKGTVLTTCRAALLTSAQVGSYDTIKNNLLIHYLHLEEGIGLHLLASVVTSVVTVTAANPADVVKTKYMSDRVGLYKNPWHCIQMTYKEGGLPIFMKGWVASYCRIGAHTIFSFVLIEQARKLCGFKTF